jgi:F-type H+-transporting ATPase subunit a
MLNALWLPLASAAEAAHEAAPAAAGEAAAAHGSANAGEILMHHVVDVCARHLFVGPIDLGPTKHLGFFVATAVIVIGLIRFALRRYRGGVPTGIAAAVESVVQFIRDEIAEKNIGHRDGRKFTPLLCSFFFFILTAALLGLMPYCATATGNISVTMGLAIISFLAMQYAGIANYGVIGHFKGIVPPGLPLWLLPIMIPVEILGMFTKPFALMVRLFANMLAGHMVIITLLMLIPTMFGVNAILGGIIIPISISLSLFIMCLELLVALIQAYIFTLLTAIFIGMYAHPAH